MNLDRREVRIKLLFSAREDWTPLYEALWEFGSPVPPDPIKDELWLLIQEGLVELFMTVDDAAQALTAEEQAEAYGDPRWWAPPVDRENCVCYTSTEAGDAAWPEITRGVDVNRLIFGPPS